jgi:hypothetical protein
MISIFLFLLPISKYTSQLILPVNSPQKYIYLCHFPILSLREFHYLSRESTPMSWRDSDGRRVIRVLIEHLSSGLLFSFLFPFFATLRRRRRRMTGPVFHRPTDVISVSLGERVNTSHFLAITGST